MNSVPMEMQIERLHNDIERLEHMVNTDWKVVWIPQEHVDQAIFEHKPLYRLVRKDEQPKCPLCNQTNKIEK